VRSVFASVVFTSAVLVATTAEGADGVAAARAAIAERSAAQTEWSGPTSGPKPEPGKKIVYLSLGENNPIGHLWGVYLKQAAERVGWTLSVLDGKGSPADWINVAKQALALKPDGIVTSADARTMQGPLAQAAPLRIPIVGLHGSAKPGPDPESHLFTNIVSDPEDIGRAIRLALEQDEVTEVVSTLQVHARNTQQKAAS